MAGNKITWDIGLYNPDTHYVYRSDVPLDPDNLPSPLATLGQGISVYNDTDNVIEKTTYYYRVDAEKMGLYIPGYNIEYYTSNIDIFGDNSIIATYNFDGNAIDLGGNYNGTETNAAYDTGLIDQALSDSYTEIPITTELDGDYSYSLWVYPTNLASSGSNSRQSFFTSDTTWYRGIWATQATFRVHDNSVYYDYNGLSNKQWQHVVVSKQQGSDPDVYFNNVIQTKTGQSSFSGDSSANSFIIGAEGPSGGYPWQGKIDQVRLFNKALTSTEVDTLYQEGA